MRRRLAAEEGLRRDQKRIRGTEEAGREGKKRRKKAEEGNAADAFFAASGTKRKR